MIEVNDNNDDEDDNDDDKGDGMIRRQLLFTPAANQLLVTANHSSYSSLSGSSKKSVLELVVEA